MIALFVVLGVSASSCSSKPTTTTSGTGPTTTTTASTQVWTNLEPSGAAPSARFGETLVYLSATEKVFMFGGAATEKDPLNDTWVYDPQNNRWLDLKPSGATPPPRWAMGAAYDPTTNQVLILGGMGKDGVILNDTWAYSVTENTWAKLSPSSSPSARYRSIMAYDQVASKFILFGGRYSRPGFQQDFIDTWAFDLGHDAWTDLSPSGATPTPSAGCGSLIGEGPNGSLLLLAGPGPLPPIPPYIPPEKLPKDWSRWVYDPSANSWTSGSPPPLSPAAIQYYALTFDSTRGKAVLFGGLTIRNSTPNDTWIYDPLTNAWVLALAGGPDTPSPRIDCAAVYDPKTDKVVLFGGRKVVGLNEWSTAVLPSETWSYLP
jgi:hypothetical protein